MSRRGNLKGVEDEFVDNMARGLDAWTSAAGRDLIRWGFLVFTKKAVSFFFSMCFHVFFFHVGWLEAFSCCCCCSFFFVGWAIDGGGGGGQQ